MAKVIGTELCVRFWKKMVSGPLLIFFFLDVQIRVQPKAVKRCRVKQVSVSRGINCGLALQFADCTSHVSSFFPLCTCCSAGPLLCHLLHRFHSSAEKRGRPAGRCFFSGRRPVLFRSCLCVVLVRVNEHYLLRC